MINTIYEYSEVNGNTKEYIINTFKLHKYFKLDWKTLKSKQYCGILNFDNQDYYLLPKISKDDSKKNLDIFIYMLIYTYDIKVENEDIASCKNETHNIIEVFIQLFAKGLFKEFQAGVYKEYITEQDNLTTLRGKYLINENLKYNHMKNKIYCEYDEFSMDNTLNRFFIYAIKTLLKYTKNKKLLKQFDIKNLHINFNRLNSRFKDSFEFAMLLLNKSVPLFERDKKSFAFLFDMNVLFEKFIGRIIKDIYKDVEIPKKAKSFEELHLKPDIIVNSENLIIDCKYKVIQDGKIASREDRYQMYVYANNFKNIDTTMLLYPKHFNHNKDLDKKLILGENDKKVTLFMKSIDLELDGGCSYSEYIKELQNRVEKLQWN